MILEPVQAPLRRFLASPGGRRALKWIQRLIVLAVLALLVRQLMHLGWRDVLTSLPTSPWFYLLYAAMFLVLPVSEVLAYRQSWRFGFWAGCLTFLRKNVYNLEVVDCAGEVYLYVWAKRRLGLEDRRVFQVIKDNTLVSAICGLIFALGLPAALLACGQFAPTHDFSRSQRALIWLGPALALVVMAVTVLVRNKVFAFDARALTVCFLINAGRTFAACTFVMWQWSVAMPDEPWHVWLTILACQQIVSRIPALPGRDMVLVAAGVGVSQGISSHAAGVAGVLLTNAVLDKIINLILFSSSLIQRDPDRQVVEQSLPKDTDALTLTPAAEGDSDLPASRAA